MNNPFDDDRAQAELDETAKAEDRMRSRLAEADAERQTASEVGHAVAGPPPSAASLREQAARLLEAAGERDRAEARALLLAREEARPKQPGVSDDVSPTVVFSKYQSGREYHFAARGYQEGNSTRWVVTGQETRRFNWPGLLEFIGEANWPSLYRMTGSERIGPDPVAEAPVAEVMGRYGRVERTETLGPVAGGDPLVILLSGGGGGRSAQGGSPLPRGGVVGGRGWPE